MRTPKTIFEHKPDPQGVSRLAGLVGPRLRCHDTKFLPEIDAHLTVNSYLRTYLQAKDDREGGDPEQFTFAPSIAIYLKPLIKLQRVTLFDLDDAKS